MKSYRMCFILMIVAASILSVFAQDVPKAELPVLTTSAGQSADVNTINVILETAGVGYDYCDVPTVAMIKDGVGLGGLESGEGFHVECYTDRDTHPEGSAFKTVVFAIGASLKGMGASGLTIEDEIERLESLLAYCEENEIFIIGVHAGGEARRGATGSDNEKMIDVIAPVADYLIVVEDGNKDGRFTKISEDQGIPLTVVPNALAIVELMGQVFE